MKRIFNFLFISLLVLTLTGCFKHNVSMEVKEDKSVTLEMVYEIALDKSMTEGSEESETEDYSFLKELGYTVENYENEQDNKKITGVKITKTFDNIDDITADKKSKVNLVSIFDKEKKEEVKNIKLFYKDNGEYVSNFEFNYQDADSDNSGMDMSSYQSMFNLECKVKLPKEATRNNATSVSEDKTEYTWKLDFSKNNDIDYAFKLGNSFNMMYVAIGGGVVLLVVVIVVVLLVSKKKKNNQPLNTNTNNMVNNNMAVNPGLNNTMPTDTNNMAVNPGLNNNMPNNNAAYNPNLNNNMPNNNNMNN